MKFNIKKWFLGDKKENYSQILEKFGRIGQLEKKVIRQSKIIRELQTNMNRFAVRITKLELKRRIGKKNG